MSDVASNIVLNMELYEGKDIMAAKDYVMPFGAITATTLRLTQPYHGTGKRVIADSWSGSVKSAVELSKRGLYSIMLVKTAHKQFPRQLLGEKNLERGDWVAYTATVDEVKVQACRFRDLKVKDFVSTCSTAIPGNPRKTNHNGFVSRPKVAEDYLKNSASIDVHNHYRTGSCGLEDIWHTKNPHRRQLAGILGFCFTNGYLAMKHFTNPNLPHYQFKIAAANALVSYRTTSLYETCQIDISNTHEAILHEIEKISYSLDCYYCNHGYEKQRMRTTTFDVRTAKLPSADHQPTSVGTFI